MNCSHGGWTNIGSSGALGMKPHETSRRSFLRQFAVTAGTVMLPSIGARAGERTAKRPNVVLIMTDDQGYGDFSCHGNPVLKTPNMDRLASQSIQTPGTAISSTMSFTTMVSRKKCLVTQPMCGLITAQNSPDNAISITNRSSCIWP